MYNHIHNYNMRLKQERYGNATLFHVETARSKAPGCSGETEEKRRGRSLGGAQRSTTQQATVDCRLEPLCAAESDGRVIGRSIPTPRVSIKAETARRFGVLLLNCGWMPCHLSQLSLQVS
jgi:hypothetical protein